MVKLVLISSGVGADEIEKIECVDGELRVSAGGRTQTIPVIREKESFLLKEEGKDYELVNSHAYLQR